MTSKRVAVLGAGLQGACIALKLARRRVTVDLYERNPACLAEASIHNEGKIHLGLVYAGDTTLKTAQLMATGALCFQPLLRRWVGDAIDRIPVSSPFHYLVREAVAVSRRSSELVVRSVATEGEDSVAYDHVVNTSWTGWLQLDGSMGIAPREKWSFRFKYFVRTTVPPGQPLVSATIVLGPFGDIACYGNGAAYLSWYPAGRVARCSAIAPPALPATLAGPEGQALAAAIASGLGSVVPSTPRFIEGGHSAPAVKGGWIFAWGTTDIDDPASRLHQRCDIGVHACGRYLSIDTGKLTMAPLFAVEAADRITGKPA